MDHLMDLCRDADFHSHRGRFNEKAPESIKIMTTQVSLTENTQKVREKHAAPTLMDSRAHLSSEHETARC